MHAYAILQWYHDPRCSSEEVESHIQLTARHRQPRSNTPPGAWDIDFPADDSDSELSQCIQVDLNVKFDSIDSFFSASYRNISFSVKHKFFTSISPSIPSQQKRKYEFHTKNGMKYHVTLSIPRDGVMCYTVQ